MVDEVSNEPFETFARRIEPRLREALSATLGSDLGRESAADALSYGWENWPRIGAMHNPAGYLYRVGRNSGVKQRRGQPVALTPVDPVRTPWIEPSLPDALGSLSEHQRVTVMLLHCFQWSMSEVAELLGVTKSTVQSHAERGLDRLRNSMGVTV